MSAGTSNARLRGVAYSPVCILAGYSAVCTKVCLRVGSDQALEEPLNLCAYFAHKDALMHGKRQPDF